MLENLDTEGNPLDDETSLKIQKMYKDALPKIYPKYKGSIIIGTVGETQSSKQFFKLWMESDKKK